MGKLSSAIRKRMSESMPLGREIAQALDPRRFQLHHRESGDITSSVTGTHMIVAPFDCVLDGLFMSLENTGEDASNDLYLEVDLNDDGTSILSTLGQVGKAAADGSFCEIGGNVGDGIVNPVSKGLTIAKGSIITLDLDLTRTASPTDELADADVFADFKEVVAT